MNHLQRLEAPEDFCVSLNMTERIDPAKVVCTITYTHPILDGVVSALRAVEGL
jgi:predicted NAD/FAD-binding protein